MILKESIDSIFLLHKIMFFPDIVLIISLSTVINYY